MAHRAPQLRGRARLAHAVYRQFRFLWHKDWWTGFVCVVVVASWMVLAAGALWIAFPN